MGLLDSLLGGATRTDTGNALIDGILGLINDPRTGGLSGLVRIFHERGLGGLVNSWVSTGANLPISAEQIRTVLGNERVAELAAAFGVSPAELSGSLTELLPKVVDTLTPGGQLPEVDSLGDLLGSLRKHLG